MSTIFRWQGGLEPLVELFNKLCEEERCPLHISSDGQITEVEVLDQRWQKIFLWIIRPTGWNMYKLTAEEIEQARRPSEWATDMFNSEQSVFFAKLQEGDEVWHWSNGPQAWKSLCGRSYYIILRDGQEIAKLLTGLS